MTIESDVISIICSKCGAEKNINDYAFRDKNKNIRHNICRACFASYQSEYRKNNKNKITENKKKYSASNKDSINCNNKRYYLENNEEIKSKRKDRYKKNKPKEREYMRLYDAKRMENDPVYRLTKMLRKRYFRSIKNGQAIKSSHWRDLLGCNIESAQQHIESKFHPHPKSGIEMTWENHGDWHIDHKIPISSIKDTNDIEQIKVVFCFTNLQPLWKEENQSKNNNMRWDGELFWKRLL